MATRAWDTVPVYGWWQAQPGVPLPTGSKVRFSIVGTDRVRRVDGRMIYPGGIIREVTIGKPEDQDATVKARIHDAMRAEAEAAQGAEFDSVAWEAEWSDALQYAIFTSFYATDDTDITPQGWGVRVQEIIPGAGFSGKQYDIQPVIAQIDPPDGVPGINLAGEDPPPGAPTVVAPVYSKGQPNGIAPLGADAKVPLEYIPDGIGGGVDQEAVESIVDTYVTENAEALRGPEGPQGPKGDPGNDGAQGPKGDKGDQGPPGTTTVDGLTDATTVGKAVAKAASAEDARDAIGAAGTATATTAAPGLVELATTAETTTGTDAARAVTPAGLAAALAPKATLTADTGIITSGRILVATTPTPDGMQAGDLVVVVPEP